MNSLRMQRISTSLALLGIVTFCVNAVAAQTRLDARFIRHGKLHPVVVVINDGRNENIRRGVDTISLALASEPTIMVQYALENGETAKEFIPRLPLGTRDTLALDFHLHGSSEQKIGIPVLLAHERSAEIVLRSDLHRDGPHTQVTTKVSGSPGTLYILDAKIGLPDPPGGVGCSACKGIPNTDHVKSLSGESTPTFSTIRFLATSTETITTKFTDLSAGTAGLVFAGVVKKSRAITGVTARLRASSGATIPARGDAVPDFLTKAGPMVLDINLPQDVIPEASALQIPVLLEDRQNRHVLIDVSELQGLGVYRATPIGDVELGTQATGFAVAVLGVNIRRSGVLVDLVAESPGWIALALPSDAYVGALRSRDMETFAIRGDIDRGTYAETPLADKKLLILRIPEGFQTLEVELSDGVSSARTRPRVIAKVGALIKDLTASPAGPKPFECVSDDIQIRSACFAFCGFAQNVGCSCSSVEGGCACECFGVD